MLSSIFPPVHVHDSILSIPEECMSVAQKINMGLELTDVTIVLYLALRLIYYMIKMGIFSLSSCKLRSAFTEVPMTKQCSFYIRVNLKQPYSSSKLH